MKRFAIGVMALACLAAVSAGCGKKVARATPAPAAVVEPPPAPPAPPPDASRNAAASTPSEDDRFAAKSLEQLNAERPLDDVFFAFDQSTLSDAARAALQKNAAWLQRWPSTRVRVEGHCDERGTPEYNLALGEKRAHVVREYLVSLGVPGERLASTTKGEEEPACTDHDESCWRQNRRGHSIITAK